MKNFPYINRTVRRALRLSPCAIRFVLLAIGAGRIAQGKFLKALRSDGDLFFTKFVVEPLKQWLGLICEVRHPDRSGLDLAIGKSR